jgi:hypothetical protein
MISKTKENVIERLSLKLIQILAFFQNEALASKHMDMTSFGNATVHHLIACLLLECWKENLVRDIARGIELLSPEPPRNLMLIEHHYGHLTQGSILPFHYTIPGVYTDSKTNVQKVSK